MLPSALTRVDTSLSGGALTRTEPHTSSSFLFRLILAVTLIGGGAGLGQPPETSDALRNLGTTRTARCSACRLVMTRLEESYFKGNKVRIVRVVYDAIA